MVKLLATGGTIASIAGPRGRTVGVTGEELLTRAGRVWPLPPTSVEDTRALNSSALTGRHIDELLAACGEEEPVVITHGTDAMEETAIALALSRSPTDPPIVLTGAGRPFDDPAPDGPRNLAAAIRWAGSAQARGTGVTVVFGDHVLPAIGVKKAHTLSLTGFASPGRGPIGAVDEGGVRKFAHPVLPPAISRGASPDVSDVHVLTTTLSPSPDIIRSVLAMPGTAVVVEAMGAGNTPPAMTLLLTEAITSGIPVVVTSRSGAGATAGLYAGGGSDLAAAGAVFAGDLPTVQARWVLAAALDHGVRWREVMNRWLGAAACIEQEDP